MNLGYYSYIAAACGYGFFVLLLLFNRRSSLLGWMLVSSMILGALWSVAAAQTAQNLTAYIPGYKALEVLRYLGWFVFLITLLQQVVAATPGTRLVIRAEGPDAAEAVEALGQLIEGGSREEG